ncbi:MAG: alpha/beta hydrolase [Pseudogulbenkiania sp.]|nr:alpha/beta hydrolase [Pseudogulbenkiania sp.]
MFDDDDIFLLTVPGWGNSAPQHWQSVWERSYPLARRVEQDDWLYPSRDAWVAALVRTLADIDGKVVIAAHSLGCHAAVAWLLSASLLEQRQVKGLLLVAPPALPIGADTVRASGELPAGAPLPEFAGFGQACAQRLPLPTIVVASRDDLFCEFAEAERMAQGWGAKLVDAGNAGHMGSTAGLGGWPEGQRLLQRLMLS